MVDIVEVTNLSTQQMPAIASWFMGPFVINVAYALLILFMGLLIGQLTKKILTKLFGRIKLNALIEHATAIDTKVDQILTSFVVWIIYSFAILLSFGQLGLANEVIVVLLSFLFILVLIFVFLSLRDFVPNLLSGIIMMVKKYMKPGDVIESRLASGTVLECELLRTVISTETGDVMYVPNSYLIKQTLVVKKVKS